MAKSEGYDLLNQTFIVKWNLYKKNNNDSLSMHTRKLYIHAKYDLCNR